MPSSTSSSNPLVADLLHDWPATRRWFLRAIAFAVVVILCDHALAAFLRRGLDRYFGLNKESEVLLVGHSRTVLGIDDTLLARELGVDVSKYAFAGANINDRNTMTKHYVTTRDTPPKVVVYDVDASMFSVGELSVGSYTLFCPYWDEEVPRQHVREFAPKDAKLFPLSLFHLTRYDEALIALSARGWLDIRSNLKKSTINLKALENRIRNNRIRPMTINESAVKTFEDSLAFCESRQITVVLAYIPTVDVLNNIDRAAHDRVIDKLKAYAEASPNVYFFDYNTGYESRHELFFDGIHLNARGNQEITKLLANDLKGVLASPDSALKP